MEKSLSERYKEMMLKKHNTKLIVYKEVKGRILRALQFEEETIIINPRDIDIGNLLTDTLDKYFQRNWELSDDDSDENITYILSLSGIQDFEKDMALENGKYYDDNGKTLF